MLVERFFLSSIGGRKWQSFPGPRSHRPRFPPPGRSHRSPVPTAAGENDKKNFSVEREKEEKSVRSGRTHGDSTRIDRSDDTE